MVAATVAAMNPWTFPGDLCLVAETSEGEFAACLCGVYAAPSHLQVHTLEVKPEYQGLGLGDSLLDRLLEAADQQGIAEISLDLPAGMEHFSRVLIRKSFEPCVQRYCRRA
jgi:ribosomal protein S18 acetylase RimI-like enzyme